MKVSIDINSLSGGVARQDTSKRLVTESENIDNCLLTLERSLEKRPPFSHIETKNTAKTQTDGLDVINVVAPSVYDILPPDTTSFNQDNIFTYFLDLDGINRYCIVINRAGFNKPIHEISGGVSYLGQFNLPNFLSVFRIEPTEWIQEEIETDINEADFDRGMLEYITYGNRTGSEAYYLAGESRNLTGSFPTKETFGAIPWGTGILLWNKLVPLDFMPNRESVVDPLEGVINSYIHSGSAVDYKIAIGSGTLANEDGWKNVRDNVVFDINAVTLQPYEAGQNRENFSLLPVTADPVIDHEGTIISEGVSGQINDANGIRAKLVIRDLYDGPRIVAPPTPGTVDLNSDHGYLTSPLDPTEDRDVTLHHGLGKIYFARSPYLTFPSSFFRATRANKHPYFERVRTEGKDSVLDHRRFPLMIFKGGNGKWRIKYMPLQPRKSGNASSNPGLNAVRKNERIQGVAFWRGRLWIATDTTVVGSSLSNYYDFWINDVFNFIETDVIDVSAVEGGYNKIQHIVPYREFMLLTTSGNTQFEIRGGSADSAVSPFNIEIRPTSFFSSSGIVHPTKVGTHLVFFGPNRLYLYIGGDKFDYEMSTAIELSEHCRGYLPQSFSSVTSSSALNTVFMVDSDNPHDIYLNTFRVSGDTVQQNAFHRWSLNSNDRIVNIKAYGSDLYVLVRRTKWDPTLGSYTDGLYPYFCSLSINQPTTPRIDRLLKVKSSFIKFAGRENLTNIFIPFYDPHINEVILPPDWNFVNTLGGPSKLQGYTRVPVVANSLVPTTGGSIISVHGNYKSQIRHNVPVNLPLWVGRSYTSRVELSKPQVRNAQQGNKTVPGSLNLRKMTIKHTNTGQYRTIVTRNERIATTVEYEPVSFGDTTDKMGYLRIDNEGELLVKLLSNSDRISIAIESDYPTPMNITSIQMTGLFGPSKDISSQI